MAIRYTINVSGFFLTGNPIGKLHQNIYDLIEDAGEVGASAAAGQLYPGHGFVTGELAASIEPRLLKASRGVAFVGRGKVVAGARGHEMVRAYQAKIDRKYKYMARGSAAGQAWVNSEDVAARLTKGLS